MSGCCAGSTSSGLSIQGLGSDASMPRSLRLRAMPAALDSECDAMSA